MAGTAAALTFCRTKPEEAAALRPLAHLSEAHWGGSASFMDTFDREYNITPAFIAAHPVYAAWTEGRPAAFWGLEPADGTWELAYFYVDETALGCGYGRQMWAHLTDWCRDNGVRAFTFVTSPQAVGFYRRMGAEPDGQAPSSIDGRPIPHFTYQAAN